MTTRLPWQRNSSGGFIAYPEGDRFPGRHATVRRDGTQGSGHRAWRWQVIYDEARTFLGWVETQQAGADAAAEAWPLAKAEAARLARVAAEDTQLRTMVQRMARQGDLPLSAFDLEESSTERLLHIIWLLRHGGLGSLDGPARPLVEACSAELYRRRTEG